MKAKKNEEAAMLECYRRMYKASTPSADFDKLMAEAPTNKQGQKVIDFMAYEIDIKMYEQIVEEIIQEFKIKPKYRANSFIMSMAFGATPKFISYE